MSGPRKDEIPSCLKQAGIKKLLSLAPQEGHSGDAFNTIRITEDHKEDYFGHAFVSFEHAFHSSMEKTAHDFRINSVEFICYSDRKRENFQKLVDQFDNPRLVMGYHVTKPSNIPLILGGGFRDDKIGATDAGYIGRGHYFTNNPEYSCAYARQEGVDRLNYVNPCEPGTTVKLMCCFLITGNSDQQTSRAAEGDSIPAHMDSNWAWVDRTGNPANVDEEKAWAKEIVIPAGKSMCILPRFLVSLTRVDKTRIWLDPNVWNSENKNLVKYFNTCDNLRCFATRNQRMALQILKNKKEGTSYKIVTSGTGGEVFVRTLRGGGINDPIIVYCMNVEYHKSWARKYSRVEVTCVTIDVKTFVGKA